MNITPAPFATMREFIFVEGLSWDEHATWLLDRYFLDEGLLQPADRYSPATLDWQ